MKLFFYILILVIFSGCIDKGRYRYGDYKVLGFKPVYSNDLTLKLVTSDTPHRVKNAGKIYAYKNYLLQCEVGEGFHVIDNSVPMNARRIKFIKVLGANEISIKNNYLYTNSFSDLVIINIADLNYPSELKRIPNAFKVNGYLPEPPEIGAYECVDLTKGVVIGWKKDSVKNYYGCFKN